MHHPLVTIITVTYNSEETLRDTMLSVLNQSYPFIEYWIIDGGSTDGTMDVVRQMQERFGQRLHYISEKDNGLYHAMNKGICKSHGDIIGILNSDDFFTSNDVLEAVVNEIMQNQADGVYGDVHFVSPDALDQTLRYYSSRYFRPSLLRFGMAPPHPSLYVRKEVYARLGGYGEDYKICADFDMMVRLFCKYKIDLRYLPRDFVTMRNGGVSTRNWQNRFYALEEEVRACKNYGIYTNRLLLCIKFIFKFFQYKLF